MLVDKQRDRQTGRKRAKIEVDRKTDGDGDKNKIKNNTKRE